jgi:hypothetical protein
MALDNNEPQIDPKTITPTYLSNTFEKHLIPIIDNVCVMEYIFIFFTLVSYYFGISQQTYIGIFIFFSIMKLNVIAYFISQLYDYQELVLMKIK